MQILVVDDDQAVRDSLARSLTYSGDDVQTATNGVEALAKLVGYTPDAIIMDVMMPRMDGLETTRMLREGGNDVPILILTARDAVGDRVDGLDAGASAPAGGPGPRAAGAGVLSAGCGWPATSGSGCGYCRRHWGPETFSWETWFCELSGGPAPEGSCP